jgi:hypothetical protein
LFQPVQLVLRILRLTKDLTLHDTHLDKGVLGLQFLLLDNRCLLRITLSH